MRRKAICAQWSSSSAHAKQDAEETSRHSDRNINLFPSWSG